MAYRCKYSPAKECNGCGGCEAASRSYSCPVCGAELEYGDTIYADEYGEPLACENCVKLKCVEDFYD